MPSPHGGGRARTPPTSGSCDSLRCGPVCPRHRGTRDPPCSLRESSVSPDVATTAREEADILYRIMTSRRNRISLEVRPSGRVEHVHERARLPQVIEELVTEAAAFVGFRHESRHVEHLDGEPAGSALARRVVRLARSTNLLVRTLLPYIGDPMVRLDRREGVVRDMNRGQCSRSEERGLPHIRFPDDPQLHREKNGLLAQEPWRRRRPKGGISRFVGDVVRSPRGSGAYRGWESRSRGTRAHS